MAYRREDHESGGTQLFEWHQWSLGRVDEVLTHFDPDDVAKAREAVARDEPFDFNESDDPDADGAAGSGTAAYMLHGILAMAVESS